MKYIGLGRDSAKTIKLPGIFGGVNYRDGLKIADNHLTDVLNMWQNGGLLRTRPGFTCNAEMLKETAPDRRLSGYKVRSHTDIVSGDYTLISISVSLALGNGRFRQRVYFLWQSDTAAGNLTVGGPEKEIAGAEDFMSYFVFANDGFLYCFYGDGTLQKISSEAANGAHWDDVSDDEIYAPTVYAHCLATADGFTGTMIEGFNALGKFYKMIFSTVNPERLSPSQLTVDMVYPIPDNLSRANGEKVTATITHADGTTVTHEAIFEGGTATETPGNPGDSTPDNLIMKIEADNAVKFYSGGSIATLGAEDYVEDNLTITLPRPMSENEKSSVYGMTQCCWFGGAAGGVKDGSRLFLCGNKGDKRALVMWSGLNNPLYFSENCYFYAGDRAYGVTAFGKQAEKLIIFKENEILYTYYAANPDISPEDLINQVVIDYEANAVYFPLVSLSASVGCDAPDTVALCRNRLVWAESGGHVWTLATVNKYNTLGIYEVSEMINKRLSSASEQIKNAVAADFDGYYALILNTDTYVMDYTSSGYKYISSYSDSGDANAKIPWWRWKLPAGGNKYAFGGKIGMTGVFSCSDSICFASAILDRNANTDTDKFYRAGGFKAAEIPSEFTTKYFDFGVPALNKRITAANISFADNKGREMLIEAVGEKGIHTSVMLEVVDVSPGGIKNKIIRNIAPVTCRLALRLSSYGAMAISDISIDYKYIGGAK